MVIEGDNLFREKNKHLILNQYRKTNCSKYGRFIYGLMKTKTRS